MKIIGIIGGCGSGKSEVSKLIQNHSNAYVINADKIGHDIIKKDTKAYKSILKVFGNDILDDNGNIDRKSLGKLVFSNNEKLKQLTSITHPIINEKIAILIDEIIKENYYDYIILEITALGSGKMYQLIDEFWYVYCNLEVRLVRLSRSRNMSKETAMSIIQKQLTDNEFRKVADVIIDNSYKKDNTYKQIIKYLKG